MIVQPPVFANNLVAKTGVEKPLKVGEEIVGYNKTLHVNGGMFMP